VRSRRLEPEIGGNIAERETTGAQRLDEVIGSEPFKGDRACGESSPLYTSEHRRPLSPAEDARGVA
jgi:hypothetical protein